MATIDEDFAVADEAPDTSHGDGGTPLRRRKGKGKAKAKRKKMTDTQRSTVANFVNVGRIDKELERYIDRITRRLVAGGITLCMAVMGMMDSRHQARQA